MIRENFYTGEPINGSPPSFGLGGGTNMSNITYSDPNERMVNLQQHMNLPFQNQSTNPFMQSVGNYGYNQGFQGYQGNPALQLLAQKNGQQNYTFGSNTGIMFSQPQFQDRIVHVPGFNPSQDTLFSGDIELEAARLQRMMIDELEQEDYERRKRIQGYFNNNYGTNYYGMPFMNNYYVNSSIIQKYKNMANEIRQQGIQKRMDFNKRLSRLAHNYLNDGISEEEINKIYEGYSYTQTAIQQQFDAKQLELHRMIPVSNQKAYQDHFNMIKNTMQSLMGNPTDLNDFLQAQGVLQIAENLEEEMHQRRDLTSMYSSDSFRRRLARAKLERGDETATSQFPTLANAAKMLDDGTMSIQAPNFFGLNNNVDRNVIINNQFEAQFKQNRQRFMQSIIQDGALNYGRK